MGTNSSTSETFTTIKQHHPVLPSPTYLNGKRRRSSQEDDGYESDSESEEPARKRLLKDFLFEEMPLEKFLLGKCSHEELCGKRIQRIENEMGRVDRLLGEKAGSPHSDDSTGSSRDSNSSCASSSEGAGTSISTGTGTLPGDPTRFNLVSHDPYYLMNRFLGESPRDGGPTPPAVRNEQGEEAMDGMEKNGWSKLLEDLTTLKGPFTTGSEGLLWKVFACASPIGSISFAARVDAE
ncbi:hypothetical protein HOY80DRAFT_1053518 [Tuber brumale]|nr:hypothetical protein HOY80DRAFT_1053518 [Tuber brumale]